MTRWVKRGIAVGIVTVGAVVGLAVWARLRYGPQIYTVESAPARRVAIVFGAGIYGSGQVTPILADRLETALALYRAGKAQKLLLTGDNSSVGHNEPGAMKRYLLARGVLESALVLDYAGFRTYDSCYRARAIFGIEEALLVTQDYHLPRALFICDALGLRAGGVRADQRRYAQQPYLTARELPALAMAFLEVKVTQPTPVLGKPLPID